MNNTFNGFLSLMGSLLVFGVGYYFVASSSCESSAYEEDANSVDKWVGTYTFYDAVGNKFIVDVNEDGSAMYRMDESSILDWDGIEAIAYRDALNGIYCTWNVTLGIYKKDEHIPAINVMGDRVDLYFCDGTVYFSMADRDHRRDGRGYSFVSD